MSSIRTDHVYDSIVVGAGLSGLCAAKYLKESGFLNILVLEAQDRVGGRTYTKKNSHVSWVDLGASYVGPNQHNILRLANELNVNTYKVYSKGNVVDLLQGERLVHDAECFAYGSDNENASDLQCFMDKVDEMGKQIPTEEPWNAESAKQWDQMTWKEFVERSCRVKKTRELALGITNDIFCASAHELSLLYVLWYIKVARGTFSIFSNKNGAQDSKFEGGSQQLSEKLVEVLGAKRVLTNKVVHSIEQTHDCVRVGTSDGCSYETRTVIIAFPPCLQTKIHYKPALPALRTQMLHRFPMGSVMKCVFYYENPFWRQKGFCGAATVDSDNNYIRFIYDDTKNDGSHPALVCFIVSEKCRELCEKSKGKQKLLLCQNLSQVFDSQEALWVRIHLIIRNVTLFFPQPLHCEQYNWDNNQFSAGGYAGFCPPGVLTQFGAVLRKRVHRLFFAGTETATQWCGYMDGAVQAGERAACEVIQALTDNLRDMPQS